MNGKDDHMMGVTREESDLFRNAVVRGDGGPWPVAAHDTQHEPPRRVQRGVPAVQRDHSTPGGAVEFLRSGVPRRVIRQLKRGDRAVDDELDLHGHTTAEAEHMLTRFVHDARVRRAAAVRIIHGKGMRSGAEGDVMRRFTLAWLRRHAAVLAFCSAPPRCGGNGAVHVLLRRGSAGG